jgi:peptidoglycan/LPS O-acetylase OafA/YrhL
MSIGSDTGEGRLSAARLSALDGLRGVAILLVIAVHYLHESGPLGALQIFGYGNLGVELFFIISGFVIALTLENCKTPYEFFVRRFARIWPPLLVCSIITFLVLKSLSSPYSLLVNETWSNFLPSLTLTPSRIWESYFPGVSFVDGVYWSLLVEARFYVIVAVIFWCFNRSHLARNLVIFTYANILCRAALQRILPGSNEIYSAVFVPDFMPWFAAGAVFYEVYVNRIRLPFAIVLLGSMIAIIFRTSTFVGDSGQSPFIISTFALLFFVSFWWVATKSSVARVFQTRILVWIGICSYSVYLLHNGIGRAVITSIPDQTPLIVQLAVIGIIAAAIILAGYVSFMLVEQPARRLVTGILLTKPGLSARPAVQNPVPTAVRSKAIVQKRFR